MADALLKSGLRSPLIMPVEIMGSGKPTDDERILALESRVTKLEHLLREHGYQL